MEDKGYNDLALFCTTFEFASTRHNKFGEVRCGGCTQGRGWVPRESIWPHHEVTARAVDWWGGLETQSPTALSHGVRRLLSKQRES